MISKNIIVLIENTIINEFPEFKEPSVTYNDWIQPIITIMGNLAEKPYALNINADVYKYSIKKGVLSVDLIINDVREKILKYLIENNIRQADSINITLFNLDLENVNSFKQLNKFKEEATEFELAILGDNDLEIAKEFLDVCQSAYSLLRKLNIPSEVLKLAQEQHNEKMKNRPR